MSWLTPPDRETGEAVYDALGVPEGATLRACGQAAEVTDPAPGSTDDTCQVCGCEVVVGPSAADNDWLCCSSCVRAALLDAADAGRGRPR